MSTWPLFPWRRIQAAFAAVVISFVAASTLADISLRDIDASASRIAAQASPAIQHLSAARAELRRLQVLAARSVDPGDELVARHEQLRAARRRFDEEVAAYMELPSSAARAQVRDQIQRGNGGLDQALEQLETAERRGEVGEARRVLWELLGPEADRASDALLAGVDAEAEHSAALALRIATDRVRTRKLSVLLDLVGVLLSAGALASVRSASKRYAALVEQNRRLLETRAEELELFAGRVAHDVMGPLAPVGFALDMTSARLPPGDPARLWLERGASALRRVRAIVDALLEFARSGASPEPRARANVATVVGDVLDGARASAEAAHIEVSSSVEGAGDVECPAGLLSTVVGNLVQNAIKYMQDAAVRSVVVRAESRDPRVRIWVEDTGPGLPATLCGNVFDLYVRGHDARTPGLGLGLATTRRIVEAYGGEVGVISAPGKGCRFWIELPRPGEGATTAAPRRHSASA